MDLPALLRFLSLLKGRDQGNKLVQNVAVLGSWLCAEGDLKDSAARLKRLGSLMSSSRKAFRFGKTLDYVQKMRKLALSTDPLVATTAANSALMGVYYVFDGLVLLSKAKVVDGDAGWFKTRGGQFWFLGETTGFLLQLAALMKLEKEIAACRKETPSAEDGGRANSTLRGLQSKRNMAVLLLIKTACNMLASFNVTPWMRRVRGKPLNDGVIGTAGIVGALCSCATLWT